MKLYKPFKKYKVVIFCEVPAEDKIAAKVKAQDNCGYYLKKVKIEELPQKEEGISIPATKKTAGKK